MRSQSRVAFRTLEKRKRAERWAGVWQHSDRLGAGWDGRDEREVRAAVDELGLGWGPTLAAGARRAVERAFVSSRHRRSGAWARQMRYTRRLLGRVNWSAWARCGSVLRSSAPAAGWSWE